MYHSKLESEQVDHLFDAILSLKNKEECYQLFDDLCTINEIKAMAQRMQVARMLDEGVTYHRIAEETGASSATISRVNRCLAYGAEGYRLVLDRVKQAEK